MTKKRKKELLEQRAQLMAQRASLLGYSDTYGEVFRLSREIAAIEEYLLNAPK